MPHTNPYLESSDGTSSSLPTFFISNGAYEDYADSFASCSGVENHQYGGVVTLDPSYDNYGRCKCMLGHGGTGINCTACMTGTYRDQMAFDAGNGTCTP